MGLGQIAEMLAGFESQATSFYPRQCTRARHRNAQCTLCADHCPAGALTWRESLYLDHEKCVRCGTCASMCPTGAIEAINPTNTELLERIEKLAKSPASIVFACPKIKTVAADGIIRVNCIGRLDISILVGAVARGVRQIELVDGACHNCPNEIGHRVAAQAIADSSELTRAFGITARISFITALPTESVPAKPLRAMGDAVSRRTFFNQLVRETTRAAAVATAGALDAGMPPPHSPPVRGELPTRMPVARRLLLDSLKRLGQPIAPDRAIDLKRFATFGITPSCSGCQMCAFFCPTGALRKIEADGKSGLAFSSAFCTNCGLCRDICYCQSVELNSHVKLTKVMNESVDVAWTNAQTLSDDEKVKRLLRVVKTA